jgi:hypothetical protein
MAAGECPSGLYKSCNDGRYCVPVAREFDDEATAKAATEAGFVVESDYRGHWLRLCSRILEGEFVEKLDRLTEIDPDITRDDIANGVQVTGALIALDEARYQDRVLIDRANGLI